MSYNVNKDPSSFLRTVVVPPAAIEPEREILALEGNKAYKVAVATMLEGYGSDKRAIFGMVLAKYVTSIISENYGENSALGSWGGSVARFFLDSSIEGALRLNIVPALARVSQTITRQENATNGFLCKLAFKAIDGANAMLRSSPDRQKRFREECDREVGAQIYRLLFPNDQAIQTNKTLTVLKALAETYMGKKTDGIAHEHMPLVMKMILDMALDPELVKGAVLDGLKATYPDDPSEEQLEEPAPYEVEDKRSPEERKAMAKKCATFIKLLIESPAVKPHLTRHARIFLNRRLVRRSLGDLLGTIIYQQTQALKLDTIIDQVVDSMPFHPGKWETVEGELKFKPQNMDGEDINDFKFESSAPSEGATYVNYKDESAKELRKMFKKIMWLHFHEGTGSVGRGLFHFKARMGEERFKKANADLQSHKGTLRGRVKGFFRPIRTFNGRSMESLIFKPVAKSIVCILGSSFHEALVLNIFSAFSAALSPE